jgi:putative ABC transport system ATP-binding protein
MDENYNQEEETEEGDILNLPPKDFTNAEVVIEVKNLEKSYELQGNEEYVVAIQNLTMTTGQDLLPIRRGEFLMLRGPSGCGKTTFLNILGIQPNPISQEHKNLSQIGTIDLATKGEITLLNKVINEKSDDKY